MDVEPLGQSPNRSHRALFLQYPSALRHQVDQGIAVALQDAFSGKIAENPRHCFSRGTDTDCDIAMDGDG